MYVSHLRVKRQGAAGRLAAQVSKFGNHFAGGYGKLEKSALRPLWYRPGRLFVRHAFASSEGPCLLLRVMVLNLERHMP
jgi:hypothetical protein